MKAILVLVAASLMFVLSGHVMGWAQTSPETPSPAAHPGDRRALERGKPIERALAVGQTHSYEMLLPADRYVSLVIEKNGVPLVATLFSPDGRKIDAYGTGVSRNGSETITFTTEIAGKYRIDVLTSFKPTPPGQYRVELREIRPSLPDEKSRIAAEICEEKYWLDSEGHFLVNAILSSIRECISGVGHKLTASDKRAAATALETASEVTFLIDRWRWGETVSEAYRRSLELDFQTLAAAARETDGKRALDMMIAVADDLRIKADHCRLSDRGLGGDVTVDVVTQKQGKSDSGWQVYYKLKIHEFARGYKPERFPRLSSPTEFALPPGRYLIWAEKTVQDKPVRSSDNTVPVGNGKERLKWDLMVP